MKEEEKIIRLYNTSTRKVEDFKPIDKENIRIYTCGPTVYHYQHLGNMRSYVFADILQRVLRTKYENVTHVINITDVGHLVGDGDKGQDKMEKGSLRTGKTVWEIADYYTKDWINDLESLNINTEDFIFTRATDFIKEQINMVKVLTEKGYTYTISDGIYFDTSKYSEYADFAKLDTANLNAGERVDMGEKKNKTDFALWKFSPLNEQRQMEWIYDGKRYGALVDESVRNTLSEEEKLTLGFPGWHIECSAMSKSVLGDHFDIHTGGIDHIPVHHTNEIAQSVCAHDGEKSANYWMHNNFLNDKSGKMSKSNDEFLRLKTLIEKKYNPAAYRYLLLTTNYRSELTFSYESLDAASNALKKLQKWMSVAVQDNENILDATHYRINQSYYENFINSLYNDLNTSSSLAIMWEMLGDKAKHAYSTIIAMNRILGLDLSLSNEVKVELSDEDMLKLEELKNKRNEARENKNYALADEIRQEIRSMGIEVND